MVVVVCSYVVSGLALVVSLLRRIHCALVPRGGGGGVRVVCVVKEKEFAIERGRLSYTHSKQHTHTDDSAHYDSGPLPLLRKERGVQEVRVCFPDGCVCCGRAQRAGSESSQRGREREREVAPSLRQTTKVEVVVINIKR